VAVVEYKGQTGKMEVPLSCDVSEKMLAYLAPVLVECSKKAIAQIADDITSQCLTLNAPTIELPSLKNAN
jgi:hypothetical protein